MSFRTFAKGAQVSIVEELTTRESLAATKRLSHELNYPSQYDLLSNNCETAVNRIVGRKPASLQVEGLYLIAGLLALMYLAKR